MKYEIEPKSMMRFSMLLVSEVTTLVGESDKVREDHTTIADMEEGNWRTGFDVLFTVIV